MFSKEVELVDNFLTNMFKEYEFNNYDIICEYPYNSGRADIVLANINKKKLKKRLKSGLIEPLKNKIQIQILFHLAKNKTIEKDKLQNILCSKSFKSNIKILIKNGYVKENAKNYIISKKYKIHISDVIAIEAKIKNIRRALEQILQTSSFANKRYILLDPDYSTNIYKYTELLANKGIGLIIVEKNTPLILKKSKTITPYSEIALLHLNEYHFRKRGSNYDCS